MSTSPGATPGSSSPATAPSQTVAQTVASDQTLLSHVPSTVDGLAVTYDPATTATISADPALRRDASALAVALAASSSANAEDLAVINVARLRDRSVGDQWFRDWRDSYDEAACQPAGGVTRHSEAQLGGRTVFIGVCAGGALTYHTRTATGEIVVSVTSVGPRRLGEKVMEGVTE